MNGLKFKIGIETWKWKVGSNIPCVFEVKKTDGVWNCDDGIHFFFEISSLYKPAIVNGNKRENGTGRENGI
jgi:hypothetical protein